MTVVCAPKIQMLIEFHTIYVTILTVGLVGLYQFQSHLLGKHKY